MNCVLKTIAAVTVASTVTAGATASDAFVRVVHASPDAPTVDVLVDGGLAFEAAPFTGVTDYAALPAPQTYNVQVVPTGQTAPAVIDADLGLQSGVRYTVAAVNTLANIEPLVLIDDNTTVSDAARVRFVHASPDAPAVDIALANGGDVLFPNVSFKGVGDYIEVPGGVYDLEVRAAGTDIVVLSLPNIPLDNATVYTVFAAGFFMPAKGEAPLQAILATDRVADARVRAIHASPDAPNVDILVNDGVAFGNAPFTGITDYANLAPDTYNIKVVPAGAVNPVVIEADLPFARDEDTTIIALNVLDSIEPLVLTDDNTLDPEFARLRFVHASPDAPAVDIALANGGAVLFPNISFKGIGDYLNVAPGTYDLEVRAAGTNIVVLSLPNIAVAPSAVYTAVAIGFFEPPTMNDPELGAIISVDNSLRGDLVRDGFVDMPDLMALLAEWGECPEPCGADIEGDNHVVDFDDLSVLLGNWNPHQ